MTVADRDTGGSAAESPTQLGAAPYGIVAVASGTHIK